MVKHDELMKPIVPPKYDVGIIAHNCTPELLKELEPWCSDIYVDCDFQEYIRNERTSFNLSKKINIISEKPINDVVVEFDCRLLNAQNFQVLVNLSQIIQESGEIGKMEYEIFQFYINKLDTYEKELIQL